MKNANVAVNGEMFVEDKQLREKYIGNTEVLNKVKILSMLPDDEHMSIQMVADYYDVSYSTINSLINDHRAELETDGLYVLKGDRLSSFKKESELNSRAGSLTLLTRRAILRCGMLLKKSLIAIQIRTYLLNIEQSSTKEQKYKATKGSDWDQKELILYDIIVTEIGKGGTLTSACEKAAIKLNKTVGACKNRYSTHIKQKIQNQDLIRRIENNKHGALKLVESANVEDLLPETEWCRTPRPEELYFNAVVCMMEDIEKHIKSQDNEINRNKDSEIERLSSENTRLKNKVKRINIDKKKIEDELHQVRGLVASAIKVKVNEEISNVFKMDKNGNLERIS